MILISSHDKDLPDWCYDGNAQEYLLRLLNSSSYSGSLFKALESEIHDSEMSKEDYDNIAFTLNSNQLDRITSGMPYSQTDILKHLRLLK